jgi:glycoprotein 2-beta-D-xylosyltransferase
MMQMFNKTQCETNIVLLDAHPQGTLDSTWLALFNTTQRLTMLPKRTLFKNMVWNMLGYNSPMLDHYGPGMPLIEEFREFFLTSFNANNNSKLNCAELNILFIWRRDYVAHPRNPTGSISRKIYNERELMKSVQEKYPSFHVRGMQIDLFNMQKQLHTIVQTDILIGMHGAGLTHAMFLPKHAAVIEMIPSYWSTANDHFYAIAKWRNLIYERWSNDDPENEAPDNYTKIPIGVMHTLIKSVIKPMCYKDIIK